ncbi:MAG: phage tail protein [Clostridia bacterium]|nr:phage tail protein [Clostridia bacterium]
MATQTASIADFSIISRWENSASGSISGGPYLATETKTATISGVPEGAVIEGAALTARYGSPYTGAALFQINGEAAEYGGEYTVELTPTETGNGEYTIVFSFRANGASGLSQGYHSGSITVQDAVVTVTYSDEPPTPPQPPEPEIDWGGDRPISVFAPMNLDRFNNNGLAVLTPTYGRGVNVGGGKCSITFRHPIDPDGKWAYLVPEAIVRAPVLEETIENAFAGIEVDLYRTNQSAALRDGPSEPTTITYPQWDINKLDYHTGEKVSWQGKNYQNLYFDETLEYRKIAPPNSSWWKEIARYSPGAPVLVQLSSGKDLYYLEDAGSGWYKMSTPEGIEGYIKASQVTFIQHLTPEETQERTIKDQLFRIVDVTVNTKAMEVEVYAEHVSYDLAAILVKDVQISKATPAFAINRIEDGLMEPYRGTISTNMTTDAAGTYTGKINGRNGMFALLDPDSGIVNTFKARFTRDNWDLFILENTHRDKGFRIKYGKNALGITWKRSRSNLALRVVPVAKDASGNDYYLPELYVESDDINDYPVKRMVRLAVKGQIGKDDGTGTGTNWTPETLCQEMRTKAQELFSVDHADQIYQEITVDFEQLGATVEYGWMYNLQQARLYDTVHAEDERVGLETAMEVTELEWDFVTQKRPRITKIKVSTATDHGLQTVAGYNIGNNSIGTEKLTEAAITEIANLLT